ncbi:DUF5719 family protein [Streptomyces solicathayae]|uniref:DUF5719 family protein n=1 Tax=Streptomyces solicathayae TaxID=3081768 RepID=A0ABZ0LWZ4_9ACTN|nr:DUF5719 family protein [Streptomyces sp. HUAS YS2]WOX24040.1 DUF5719 family protein [Streptomyces sp. HUAS YS2]
MKRTTLSLIAAATALAAVTGFAALTAPDGDAAAGAKAPTRLPVERSSLLCPAPSSSEVAETVYTSYTPAGTTGSGAAQGADGKAGADKAADKAELLPSTVALVATDPKKAADAAKKPAPAKPTVTLTKTGTPVVASANGGAAPALVGSATGTLAPGWTTQQTTVVPAGGSRGLLGTACAAPDTDFWFPAASTAKTRQDYVHLTNPDDTAAVADIELYGPGGKLKSQLTEGIAVPARSSVPVLLSTLTAEPPAADVTVHVTTRTGRVGAVVRVADDKIGSDWLPASADPTATAVLPGIPADATGVRLVAYAPGEDDAELKIQFVGASGTIVPAAGESLTVKSGMTAALDLPNLTRGEAGALLLTPADPKRATPVVAALRLVRGAAGKQETAFVQATGPLAARGTAADNRAAGSTLLLTAPGETAQVKVTASAGSGGGATVSKTVTVKGRTTMSFVPPVPSGLKGSYALTIEPVSGGPVHAARMLALPKDGIPMFTVQTIADDRGTVEVPAARQDLTVLDD